MYMYIYIFLVSFMDGLSTLKHGNRYLTSHSPRPEQLSSPSPDLVAVGGSQALSTAPLLVVIFKGVIPCNPIISHHVQSYRIISHDINP